MRNNLWYNSPAADWNSALPVGNGHLGAMIFGGTERETIQLNEDSIWSGGKRVRNNPAARGSLEEVRKLLREEKISEAEELVNTHFCGVPIQQRHYQPLGELTITQNTGECSEYRRSLDLSTAVHTTEWSAGGVKYSRKVIVSHPDDLICVYFTANKAGMISFTADIDGRDDDYDENFGYNENTILFTGCPGGGIAFSAAVSALSKGGKVYTVGRFLHAESCDEVLLVISAKTSFYLPNHREAALNTVRAALLDYSLYGFLELLRRHIADYRSLFARSELNLGGGCDDIPTDKRIERLRNDEGATDNSLAALYWSFAKYLMISGSREGTLPLNLQGIWNKDMWPAWGCKYTININTEMNYWGAESMNLSECHRPLFDHIERMRENGRVTAREMYGCGGFVAHHNTDIWGDTAPQDLWTPGTQWPMGAAWLCLHIWEHFLFTGDMDFLREKYQTMREAAEFFCDFLTENKKGQLIVSPSVSPENTYITASGSSGSVCEGAAMDSQILRELFTAVTVSADILDIDEDFRIKLCGIMDKLPPNSVGKHGQIMEWAVDYDEAEPGHRHISQLFALYPAAQITPVKTPDMAKAAAATIDRRLSFGGGHTGWSRAWIINMRARLLDGEQVYFNVRQLLSHSTTPNMLDSHPPFQIDGNFGGAAGITEALLQSQNGELLLLPALPTEWSEGSFSGLCARGGFVVSAEWSGGRLCSAKIFSRIGGALKIRSEIPLEISAPYEKTDELYIIRTAVGGEVKIAAK